MRPLMLVGLLILGSCGKPMPPDPQNQCSEFTYLTKHNDVLVKCTMLWCVKGRELDSDSRSGLATLWCDELEKKEKTAP